jgi:hypothetical protein
VAKTQQLVANMGAANESINKPITPSFTLNLGAIDAHTMRQGTFCHTNPHSTHA